MSMPYLGFMGDWDAEPIVDEPEWENDTVIPIMDYGYYGVTSHGTCLLTNRENTYTVLGEVVKTITRDSDGMTIPVSYVDPDRIAISPMATASMTSRYPGWDFCEMPRRFNWTFWTARAT